MKYNTKNDEFTRTGISKISRFQWPRTPRRGFATARFLGSWVRMLPWHGSLSIVNVVCCQVEVSASYWSNVPI